MLKEIIDYIEGNYLSRHYSIQIKIDCFKDPVLNNRYYMRFMISDGSMTYSGRTLSEAFQNYLEFDNDYWKNFDQETEARGFEIYDIDAFAQIFDQLCESLDKVKKTQQLKLAV